MLVLAHTWQAQTLRVQRLADAFFVSRQLGMWPEVVPVATALLLQMAVLRSRAMCAVSGDDRLMRVAATTCPPGRGC